MLKGSNKKRERVIPADKRTGVEKKMGLSPRSIVIRILQAATVALIGVYFFNMYGSVSQLRVAFSLEDIWSLLLSIGLISIGFFLLPMPALILLRSVGKRIRFSSSMRIFFFSEVGKYLPGKVWVAVGRVLLYTKIGVRRETAIFILALELVLMVVTAFIFPGRIIVRYLTVRPGLLAILMCCVLSFLFFVAWKRHITAGKIREYIPIFAIPVIIVCISFTLFWVVVGFAFQYLIVYVAHINIGPFPAMQIFSASWAAGFLAFFMPVGLGVREAFMTELLVPLIGNENAMLIAVVSRIWWTIVEAAFMLLSSGRMFSAFLRTNALPEIVRKEKG